MPRAAFFCSLLVLLLHACQAGKTRNEPSPGLDAGRIEDGFPVLTADPAEAAALFRDVFGATNLDEMHLLQDGEGSEARYYLYAEGTTAERDPDGQFVKIIMRFRAVRKGAVITLPPLAALEGESCTSRACEACAFLPQGGCDCPQEAGDGAQVQCEHSVTSGMPRLKMR